MLSEHEESLIRDIIDTFPQSIHSLVKQSIPTVDPTPESTGVSAVAIPPNAGPQQDNPGSGLKVARAIRLVTRPNFMSLASFNTPPVVTWWDSASGAISIATITHDPATFTAMLTWDNPPTPNVGVLIITVPAGASVYFYYFSGHSGARVAAATSEFNSNANGVPANQGIAITSSGIHITYADATPMATWSPIYPSIT